VLAVLSFLTLVAALVAARIARRRGEEGSPVTEDSVVEASPAL
jgi:hypothetical protein